MAGRQGSRFAQATAALLAMTAEADELKRAVGGSITNAVADWLAPQYALAAREQLAGLQGEARLKLLRTFAQDWALLRKGDQTAERLRIERERLALAERDSLGKFKRKVIVGLETFMSHVKQHPKAQAAFDALAEQLRHPFDPDEHEPGT